MGTIIKIEIEDAMRLSEELGSLSRQQFEALQHSPYFRMSQTEAWAYDRRRLRIGEISDLLTKFRQT